jgi:hypothetical protein
MSLVVILKTSLFSLLAILHTSGILDIRHNNSKGLLFKHGYQNKMNEVCDLYNNVICEDGTCVEKHSSDISNIPDVCKMASKENNEVLVSLWNCCDEYLFVYEVIMG